MTTPEPATIHILMERRYPYQNLMTTDLTNLHGTPIMYFLTREAALTAMRGRAPVGELPPDGHVEYLEKDDVGAATAITYWDGNKCNGYAWWVVSDVLKGDHRFEGQVVLGFIHRLTGESAMR